VKGENTVKVVGPDLTVNEAKAAEIVSRCSTCAASRIWGCSAPSASPTSRSLRTASAAALRPERRRRGRHRASRDRRASGHPGLRGRKEIRPGGAVGGAVSQGPARHPADPGTAPDGAQIPLGQLATIAEEDGPSVIYARTTALRSGEVFRARPRSRFHHRGGAGAREVGRQLPYDTHLEWAGEADQMREAAERLLLIIPLTLVLIAFLVYSAVGGVRDMAIVLLSIPVACAGGAIALFVTGTHLSISQRWVHLHLRHRGAGRNHRRDLREEDVGGEALLDEGALLAAERGLRPALMTASVALIGLLRPLSPGASAARRRSPSPSSSSAHADLAVLPRLLLPPCSRWPMRAAQFPPAPPLGVVSSAAFERSHSHGPGQQVRHRQRAAREAVRRDHGLREVPEFLPK